MRSYLRHWFFVLLPRLLTQCGTASFDQEWKTTLADPHQKTPQDITGAWAGTWRSDANGHHGVLRCIVSHEDGKSDDYRFHYHATYGKMLSAAYVVTEQVKRRGDHFILTGDHDLGYFAGGMYHYEGSATAKTMKSTYRSPADHGVFELARP
jgi:hypothetical protein